MRKVLQCIAVSTAISIAFGYSTANILPVLIGILYGFVLWNDTGKNINKNEKVCIYILSTLFTIFLMLGQLEEIFRYESKISLLISFIITTCGLYLFFELLLQQIVYALRDDSIVINRKKNKYPAKYAFLVAMICILICWGVSFIIAYPADFSWDSSEVLEQALGTMKIDIQYPLFMTMWLRLCWNLGYMIWGTANAGVAVYILVQMILMALSVSYVIYRMYSCNVKISVCSATLVFYAIMPYNAHYSHSLFKDIPFSVCTLIFMQLIWEFYVLGLPEKKNIKFIKFFLFYISGIGMALSRTNGYYAFLFFIPFGVILFYKRHKKLALSLVLVLIAIKIIQGPLYDYVFTKNNQTIADLEYPPYDIRYKDIQKMKEEDKADKKVKVTNATSSYATTGFYIITVQQLARVAVDRELSGDEYTELNQFFDVEKMREEYKNFIVNPALALLKVRNTEEYLNTWLRFGIKYPYTYLIAWRDQTYGYYYPDIQYGAICDGVYSEMPEVYADSIFSNEVVAKRKELDDAYTKIPVYGIFWSIGFIVWITFLGIALTITKRDLKLAFVYAPLIGIWLTLLVATPVFAEFRYIYPFFLCLPLSVVIPFIEKPCEE